MRVSRSVNPISLEKVECSRLTGYFESYCHYVRASESVDRFRSERERGRED